MTPASPDAVLESAVDLARGAVLEIAPADHLGDHRGFTPESDGVATHTFECRAPGYRGWAWAVTVALVPDGARATVSEVVLLPGQDALLAPEWLPWNERVRPGDLGPGDLFPTDPDDPRLEPGFGGADALEAADETAATGPLAAPLRPEQWELGLGRETVLSAYGVGVAADRWYDGDFGPESPMAQAAPAPCRSCGFLLPIGGLVGQAFGVCANELGADGRVVALGYGCGAHSSVRELDGTGVPVTDIAVDEYGVDALDLRADERAPGADVPAAVAGLVADGSEVVVLGAGPAEADEDLDREVADALAVPVVGLEEVDEDELGPADEDAYDEDDLDEDGYDEDEDEESDEDDESDDDEEPEDVSPDQIALELDDVEDIEPDETL